MKVQWQLIDIETKKLIALGCPFDLIEELTKEEWRRQLYGTSDIKEEPVGILRGLK